jgi:hypothetical protein
MLFGISLKSFVAKKRHEAIIQNRKKRKKKKEMIRKKKRKMRINIAHVLTKICQVTIKREIYFKEHSRIRLATKNFPHICTS